MTDMTLTTVQNMTNDELVQHLPETKLMGIEAFLLYRLEEATNEIDSLKEELREYKHAS